MPVLDQTFQNRYRGIIGWNGYTDGAGNVIPHIEVELFIKDSQIPIRKPTVNELVGVSLLDPVNKKEIGVAALFYGAPQPLSVQFSGWIITPYISNAWQTTDTTGTPLSWGNIPYTEVINRFLSGRANLSIGGARQRKDPDYYISPQGFTYSNPIMTTFEPSFTTNPRKQPFTMQLLLEY